jgi:Tol biopolymer transport system component
MARAHLIIVALFAVAAVTAGQAQSGHDLFQKALAVERADGNLRGAIQLYDRVVRDFPHDRALAARALVRMAECYEKLGDARAQSIYRTLVDEYPDQRDAVTTARTRLDAIAAPRSPATAARKLWGSQDVESFFGNVSADGRRVLFAEPTHGHLVLRDLVTGVNRLLTNEPGFFYTTGASMSRNADRVVFNYDAHRQWELRIASLQGTGVSASRRLLDTSAIGVFYPEDWSPDGQSVAVVVQRADRTFQLGIVSTADGAFRALRSFNWQRPARVVFSPSGGELAFSLPHVEGDPRHDIFVLAVDGSRERPLVASGSNDRVVGWTPDGTRVLFASDRNGSFDLWAVPLSEDRVPPQPTLVKAGIGDVQPLGVSTGGVVYLSNVISSSDIEVVGVDPDTGRMVEPPARPIDAFVGSNSMPAWSRDGRLLAFVSQRPDGVVIGVRATDSGATRELRPGLRYINSFAWAPDQGSFAVAGADPRGRQGIYRVDAQTGQASPLVLTPTAQPFVSYGPQWSPDGARVFFRRNIGGSSRSFHELDVASGAEREVARGSFGALSVSPDGRWLATTDQWTDDTGNGYAVLLIATDTGAVRELYRVAAPQSLFVNPPAWTPDGQGLLVRKRLADCGARQRCASELVMVPVAGGPPRKLEVNVDAASLGYAGVAVHPSGRKLAFVAGQTMHEIWALEHIVPPAPRR